MPRYLFHIDDGSPGPDPDGYELDNIAAAKVTAMRLFSELVRDHPAGMTHGEELRLQVTDAAGLALFDLNLLITDAPAIREYDL